MRSCEGVWECARMFKSVWGCVSTWEGMQGCARAYRRDCVRAFEAIWCHVSACQDVWECMSMGESVVGPARVCEGMRGHVRAWEYVCGCARVCECVQEHLRASEGMWGHAWACSVPFSSVTQSCLTLCDPMNGSTPGLPVHHQLLESTQTHVHWVGDAIQSSHPLSSPSPPVLNLSQHQGLLKRVSSLHQVAKVL